MKNIDDEKMIAEESSLSEDDIDDIFPPENIFSYTEQRSCFDISRMVDEGILDRDPFFQRDDIWQNVQKTKFIDSLLKRLPIPSLCFSIDADERYQVIDGKQRVKAIIDFLSEKKEWKLSELSSVDNKISGKTNFEIREYYPQIITTIKNVTLPINMVKCNYEREDNLEYIFKIFHRLNSGGTSLNNQEIRNCIYSGSFADLLKTCNKNSNWTTWVPKIASNNRMKGEERILLFFALFDNAHLYNGKLSSFLNSYMSQNRKIETEVISNKLTLFQKTLEVASKIKITQRNVYIDSILYAIAKNYDNCKDKTDLQLNELYEKVLSQPIFAPEKVQEGTAQKSELLQRLDCASLIFGE